MEEDRPERAERRVRRQPRRIEVVGGVGLERSRGDEPEWVERGEADQHEEGVPREHADHATAFRRSHAATACRRTHTERPINTLAIPSSITATLAAVPLAPFEKL